MRVVGSAEPPGGKPTMKRIGFDGYWGRAEPAQSSRTSASAALDSLFMGPPPGLDPTRAAFLAQCAPAHRPAALERVVFLIEGRSHGIRPLQAEVLAPRRHGGFFRLWNGHGEALRPQGAPAGSAAGAGRRTALGRRRREQRSSALTQ